VLCLIMKRERDGDTGDGGASSPEGGSLGAQQQVVTTQGGAPALPAATAPPRQRAPAQKKQSERSSGNAGVPAEPSDYIGLFVARKRGVVTEQTPELSNDFGQVVSFRTGTLGIRWSVLWLTTKSVEEYSWSGLRYFLVLMNALLENPETAEEAVTGRASVAAKAAERQSAQAADTGAGASRPHRERVRSVRAPTLEEAGAAEPNGGMLPPRWNVLGLAGHKSEPPAETSPEPLVVHPPKPKPVAVWKPSVTTGLGGGVLTAPVKSKVSGSVFGHVRHKVAGHRPPASGYKGVYPARHKKSGWRAEGKHLGTKYTIGNCYPTAREAAHAFDEFQRKHGMPEHLLNFPRMPWQSPLAEAAQPAEKKPAEEEVDPHGCGMEEEHEASYEAAEEEPMAERAVTPVPGALNH
jgi:hypothetical protein